jgi:rhamnose utilization protein RhaD (predicted bifunctional aldolase and dehydrogenase)/NAD(P)-dependent dehydrogenase (short-subunit alcohol dehydrogenase family)
MMENLFKEDEAIVFTEKFAAFSKELAMRVYTSRLIGNNNNLVLHGGGNTSVKTKLKNIIGDEKDVLFIKGSGKDLSTIGPEGFVGLNLDPLLKLRHIESIPDSEMDNQLKIHRISSQSPDPSVETLLHAFLPHKYVDHTHADSILILTNQKHGEDIVKEALGLKIAVVPYTMSGLPLAKSVIEQYEKDPDIDAIVIINHGIFTFSESAGTSYENMIDYVSKAEAYIEEQIQNKPLMTPRTDFIPLKNFETSLIRTTQIIRGSCAHPDSAGRMRRFHVETRCAPDLVDTSLSKEAQDICRSGVLTPDHAIRTKNRIVYIESVPENDDELKKIINQAIETFKKDYHLYYQNYAQEKGIDVKEPDFYPLLFLVAGLGLIAFGVTREEACIAADIGEHTIRAKLRANALGEYLPISESHVFDMEFWSLQQKKLSRSNLPLEGQVAVITGGGGAIGFGIADRLIAAGAVVVISDIDRSRLQEAHSLLTEKYSESQVESIVFDVTNYPSVEKAFVEISRRLGGIDIVVPNAGIAHVAKIEDLDPEKLDQVISVNLKGTFTVIKASVPIFRRQGTGGNIVVISSKNVFDPGAAFGAYSASKAGAHQISKIAAMELAELGVRVNMVNPDAVFGDEKVCSKLWELVGPERMKSRGLDADGLREYYCERSLLKVHILAEHVGNAVVFFASDLTPTTGATLPVDGGNPAAFPR